MIRLDTLNKNLYFLLFFACVNIPLYLIYMSVCKLNHATVEVYFLRGIPDTPGSVERKRIH